MAGAGSILGNAVQRLEDPTLLTGEGKYVDDLVETGMLYVSFVRSTVAHGTIVSVDISDAESMPGVVAVYHARGDDLGLPSFQGFAMMPEALNRPVFATDKVRFVGDVVAAVVAETKAQATDAAEAVHRRLRRRCRRSPRSRPGWQSDAPLLFPDTRLERLLRHRRSAEGVDDPLEGADAVAEVHHGQPAARRCADGEQRHRRRARRATASRCGSRTRRRTRSTARYAPVLGLEPEQLRVVCPWVGGGFGPKAAGYVEHIVAGEGRAHARTVRSSGPRPDRRTWCRSCTAATT